MIELLLFILGWILPGALGWVIGTIIDCRFYKMNKSEWKVLPLCLLIGPVIWIVAIKVLIEIWIERRKKNNAKRK